MGPDVARHREWRALLGAALAAATLTLGAQAWGATPAHLLARFPRAQLILETAGPRCVLLDIFLATDEEQREQGLMYVESLGELEGMYFPSTRPVGIVMWMKNTYIPLDMVFVGQDGTVTGVARNTRPLSTDRIPSPGPVIGVLEVNSGFAERWRVDKGTRVLLSR